MFDLPLFFESAKSSTLQSLFAALTDEALEKVIEFASAEEDDRNIKLRRDSVAKRLNESTGGAIDGNY